MSFFKRNIVGVVMIPSIIGLHFGWNCIQNNKSFVPTGKHEEQPIISVSFL